MNTKKIVLSGLLAGLIIFLASQIVTMIFGIIFPSINAEYQNLNIFRARTDPLMLLFFVHPFLLGIILSWFWEKTLGHSPLGRSPTGEPTGEAKSIFGENIKGGVKFGLTYWIVATIPGMFITYASMPYSLPIVISWLAGGLVNGILAGIVLMKLNKQKNI